MGDKSKRSVNFGAVSITMAVKQITLVVYDDHLLGSWILKV